MKKKNGFTLIELLAVIVILGILLGVTTISVVNIKNKQDRKNYENVISSILTGAKQYVTDNNLSTGEVEVSELITYGYVDFDESKFDSSKYTEISDKTIIVEQCSFGSIKRVFKIGPLKVNETEKTYNDCGCQEQDNGVSEELCVE